MIGIALSGCASVVMLAIALTPSWSFGHRAVIVGSASALWASTALLLRTA